MANYEDKQMHSLQKISDEISKLDTTLGKLDETNNSAKAFIEQKKAEHEIRSLINEARKVVGRFGGNVADNIDAIKDDKEQESAILDQIDQHFAKLDTALATLDDSDTGKVKQYIEEKKAIHQVKAILNKAGLYADYRADELDGIENILN